VIRNLRLRLTLWYLGLFSLLFLMFSVFLYGVLSNALLSRLDERLSSEANTAASLFLAELEELNGDTGKAAAETVAEMRPRGVLLAIFENQRLLTASASAANGELEAVSRQALIGDRPDLAMDLPGAGAKAARASSHRFVSGGRTYLATAVEPLDSVAADLASFRRVLFISFPLLLVVAGLGGFLLATRGLAPLGWMARQSSQITGSSLHRRLEIGDAADELAVLAGSFNQLLARLDQSFETMRRFVADASHELRTPLSVIRGEAEVSLAKERGSTEYRESLAIILDESRRLCRLVDDLLNLARADAGYVKLRIQEFYADDLLADCCRSMKSLATSRQIEVACQSPEDVPFTGDEELLRRLVLNLLDNAIRFTPPGGKVTAALDAQDSRLSIQVTDTGIGISEDSVPHVFDRFYRADKARSRHEGGFGLGLSIVKWIAEAHGGSVNLTSQAGVGSTFTVTLPR
jgi:heavy metal sensor kinase